MSKKRLDTDEAFKSIMGMNKEDAPLVETTEKVSVTETVKMIEMEPIPENTTETGKELMHRTYYITKKQYKALKIKAATSNNPQEKDLSAIVRAALDLYLFNTKK